MRSWVQPMTCGGTNPPAKVAAPKLVTAPVLKFFNPPSPQTFYFTPSDWKWLFLHFSHMATSNKHMFTFPKLL